MIGPNDLDDAVQLEIQFEICVAYISSKVEVPISIDHTFFVGTMLWTSIKETMSVPINTNGEKNYNVVQKQIYMINATSRRLIFKFPPFPSGLPYQQPYIYLMTIFTKRLFQQRKRQH